MPDFDCCEFIFVAEDLITGDHSDKQSHLRTAVGRTYYAAYGLLRRLLIAKYRHPFGEAGKHKKLIRSCIGAPTNPRLGEVGQWVKKLEKTRVKADYQSAATSNVSPTEAEDSVDAAKKAVKLILNLSDADLAVLHRRML